MGTLFTSFKLVFFMGVLSLVGIVVGTFSDVKWMSDDFMNSDEIKIVKRLDGPTQRNLASSNFVRPAVQYVAVNQENRQLIDASWKIIRVLDKNGHELDLKGEMIFNFELVATSRVRIEGDDEQVYYISLLTQRDTIALFKSIENGYEIIEAKRVASANDDKIASNVVEENKVNDLPDGERKIKGLPLEHDMDLVLESAIMANTVYKSDVVSGEATIISGAIENMMATVNDKSVDIRSAEIKDGGVFSYETFDGETATGLISNSGKETFKVRFSSGPFAGIELNFMTRDKFSEIMDQQIMENDKKEMEMIEKAEKEEEMRMAKEEEALRQEEALREKESHYTAAQIEALEAQKYISEQRRQMMEERMQKDGWESEPTTDEEKEEVAKKEGFAF